MDLSVAGSKQDSFSSVCRSLSGGAYLSHAYEVRILSGYHCLQGQSKYFLLLCWGRKGRTPAPDEILFC